jgi:hypothetical protein
MALTKPRAYQIYDIDYKQATRVVTVTNITLTGGAPNNVDGVTLSLNDRVLVTGQADPTQNGIYIITTLGSGANGTWARSNDTNETGELLAGTIVMVTEGVIYADTQWKLITDNPIAIGTTPLVFTQNYYANVLHAGNSNVTVYSNANVTITAAGAANVLTVASDGVYVIGNVSATGNVTANYVLGNGYNLTGLANVTFGNAPPTSNLVAGDIWIDSTTGIQYIWFNDITGNVWAEMEAQTAYSSTGYANLTTNTLNTQILYNSANAIVGSNALTFDGTTVSVTGIAVNANLSITGNTIQSTASNANLTITTTGSAAYVNMTGGFGVYSSGGNRLIQTVSDTVNFYTPMLNSLDSAIDIIGTPDGNIIPVNNTGVMLHITGQPTLPSRIYNDAANSYAAFIGRAINGNVNAPTQITAGQTVARFAAQPYANGAYPALSTTRIDMVATETQTTANAGSQITFWATPQGSNTIAQVMSIANTTVSVSGTVVSPIVAAISTSSQSTTDGGLLYLQNDNGSAEGAGNRIGGMFYGANTGVSAGPVNSASIEAFATQTWSVSGHGTKLIISTTANGSASRTTAVTVNQDQTVNFANSVSVLGNITSGNVIANVLVNNGSGNIYHTGNLLPSSNVYNLGLPTVPWQNAYFGSNSVTILANDGNLANAVTIENFSGNISMGTTGFYITALGNTTPVFTIAPVTGQIYSNALTVIANSTQSSNVASGSLQTAGGAGIAKNLYVGGNTNIAGNLSVAGTTTYASIVSNVISASGNVYIAGNLSVAGTVNFVPGTYGSFANTANITTNNNNTPSVIIWDTAIANSGVTYTAGNSRVTVTKAGNYQINYTAMFNGNGGSPTGYFWLRLNGADVGNSMSTTATTGSVQTVVNNSTILTLSANAYVEVVWAVDNHTNGSLQAYAANTTFTHPGSPSATITITPVSV